MRVLVINELVYFLISILLLWSDEYWLNLCLCVLPLSPYSYKQFAAFECSVNRMIVTSKPTICHWLGSIMSCSTFDFEFIVYSYASYAWMIFLHVVV